MTPLEQSARGRASNIIQAECNIPKGPIIRIFIWHCSDPEAPKCDDIVRYAAIVRGTPWNIPRWTVANGLQSCGAEYRAQRTQKSKPTTSPGTLSLPLSSARFPSHSRLQQQNPLSFTFTITVSGLWAGDIKCSFLLPISVPYSEEHRSDFISIYNWHALFGIKALVPLSTSNEGLWPYQTLLHEWQPPCFYPPQTSKLSVLADTLPSRLPSTTKVLPWTSQEAFLFNKHIAASHQSPNYSSLAMQSSLFFRNEDSTLNKEKEKCRKAPSFTSPRSTTFTDITLSLDPRAPQQDHCDFEA